MCQDYFSFLGIFRVADVNCATQICPKECKVLTHQDHDTDCVMHTKIIETIFTEHCDTRHLSICQKTFQVLQIFSWSEIFPAFVWFIQTENPSFFLLFNLFDLTYGTTLRWQLFFSYWVWAMENYAVSKLGKFPFAGAYRQETGNLSVDVCIIELSTARLLIPSCVWKPQLLTSRTIHV